mgnify:CR=1 FL=1
MTRADPTVYFSIIETNRLVYISPSAGAPVAFFFVAMSCALKVRREPELLKKRSLAVWFIVKMCYFLNF